MKILYCGKNVWFKIKFRREFIILEMCMYVYFVINNDSDDDAVKESILSEDNSLSENSGEYIKYVYYIEKTMRVIA